MSGVELLLLIIALELAILINAVHDFTHKWRCFMSAISDAMARALVAVQRIEDKGDAFLELARQIVALLRENAGDPAAVNAIADRLEAQAGDFERGIEEFTPPPTP